MVRRLPLVAALTAAVLGGGALTAGAAYAAPSASASATHGSAVTPSGSVQLKTVKNVGGGTWNYGSYLGVTHPKTCYSNYVHNSNYHSSTAIIANGQDKEYASATYWSNASTWAGAAYTCYTYWNNNA
jgi:hypothetical protein